MSPEWKAKILAVDRESEDGAIEFVTLVDEAVHNCDLDTARFLMKTFTTDNDYGVQERVEMEKLRSLNSATAAGKAQSLITVYTQSSSLLVTPSVTETLEVDLRYRGLVVDGLVQ